MRPPGKMYFWIQPYECRVAGIRSCSIRIACSAIEPPGASAVSRTRK
jgi:hypothetical protein